MDLLELLFDGLVALAIGFAFLVALMLLISGSRITRIALRRIILRAASRDEMPAATRAALDAGKPALAELGFHYRFTTAQNDAAAAIDHVHYTDVYQHADGLTHALVTVTPLGLAGDPYRVNFLSRVENRPSLLTMNCRVHEWMVPFPNTETLDPYVAGLDEAWRFHQQRMERVKGVILAEGPAFLHAYKEAVESQLKHGEQLGLLRREGKQWFMPWKAAIAYAARWNLAQRRVAKVRARAPVAAPAPAGAATVIAVAEAGASRVESEVALFEKHMALKRSLRWSSRGKWQMFAITAVLFLGVGSLWISWTFLPILLAVIALHEGGHFLAMKLSGYGNLSVFFVPGLGGAAVGEKPTAGPWEKMFVYLAGPVPGIALATAGLIGMVTGAFQPEPWFTEFLLACLIINYLNLLPVTPLDGGRIVETFLFARLPVARFGFAVLGFLLLLAYGLSGSDKVILVVAALVGFGLPHHWRLMQVDRAVERHGDEVLTERGATERVFTALQRPTFARWDVPQRITVVESLLPELQGRRARPLEAAGGLVVYVLFLVAPVMLAVLAFPGGWQTAAAITGLKQAYVPDDIDVTPDVNSKPEAPGRDWLAEAERIDKVAEPQRLEVLLRAAELANLNEEPERRDRYTQAAWAITQAHPAGSTDRARTMFLLAQAGQNDQERDVRLRQFVQEQDAATDARVVVLRARARERLAWADDLSPRDKVLLLEKAVADYETAKSEPFGTSTAQMALATAYDQDQQSGAAEALLRKLVDAQALPAANDRRRDALQARVGRALAEVDLAWFLLAKGRTAEASALLQTSAARLPERITVSWEHPHRSLRDAQLWASLQARDGGALQAWERYEASRASLSSVSRPVLMHEIDRLVVAKALGDAGMQNKAREGVRAAMEGRPQRRGNVYLCDDKLPAGWQEARRRARSEAAKELGLCGSGV